MKGILNVLKPPNMTSHDVVSVVRKKFNIKKVGHTGTLDPMAVGVLPICIGKATKVVDYIQEKTKTYRAELTLGQITDTQDKWGKVIETRKINVSKDTIFNIIKSYIGDIEQIPPMYSALKYKGKKLYELAREGVTIDRKARNVSIYSIIILNITDNKILFDVHCSKGTYIRTLCHDIGLDLGCGAHMSFLARLKSGNFTIENTITIEELQNLNAKDIESNYLYNIDYPMYNFQRINLDKCQLKSVLNGCPIDIQNVSYNRNFKTNEPVLIYVDNLFLALGEFKGNNLVKIKKLFS